MQTFTLKENEAKEWEKKEPQALQPQLTLEELHRQWGKSSGQKSSILKKNDGRFEKRRLQTGQQRQSWLWYYPRKRGQKDRVIRYVNSESRLTLKIIDRYEYPKSSRASIAGLRHYTLDGEEQKLPSVTTVIGQTQPKDKQESLDRWRQRVGLREAQKITRDAAIRGTALHK